MLMKSNVASCALVLDLWSRTCHRHYYVKSSKKSTKRDRINYLIMAMLSDRAPEVHFIGQIECGEGFGTEDGLFCVMQIESQRAGLGENDGTF